MYRRIMVPLDGSSLAKEALPFALALAQRVGATLHLVTAVTTLPSFLPREGDEGRVKGLFEEKRERARLELEALVDRLEEYGRPPPLHLDVVQGAPSTALPEHVRAEGVDLVVMTTHGRGPLERLWLGSVADRLVREASCPVVLWRGGLGGAPPPGAQPLRRILVPLDGSRDSESILPHAAAIAAAFAAALSLVTVTPASLDPGGVALPRERGGPDGPAPAEEPHHYLAGLARDLKERGLEADGEVLAGDDAAPAILQQADRLGADLLALSTRGRGGVARMVLGSVADKLVRAASVPVLAYRASGGADGAS